ncbi:Yip1 family protein [Paracoccaceae bacterium Fryx2]|nr:Yip1 family protein [Paracoccaceae bacterium Fryx2]
MELTLASFWQLVRHTLQKPRQAASYVMSLGVPMAARWAGMWLMAAASALIMFVSFSLMPISLPPMVAAIVANPLQLAAVQVAGLIGTVLAIHFFGRLFGGTGSLADALLLVVWLQVILLGMQLVQLATDILLPPLAGVVAIMSMLLSPWLLTNFVAELHGFRSLFLVFLGIIAATFLLMVGLAFLMALVMAPGQVGI